MSNEIENYEGIRQNAYTKSTGKMIPVSELNKFKQKVAKEASMAQLKYRILIVVVAAITTITSHMVKQGVDNAEISRLLDAQAAPYVQVIQDNTHRTNSVDQFWIDGSRIGESFSEFNSDNQKHFAIYSLYKWYKDKGISPGVDFDTTISSTFDGKYPDRHGYYGSIGLEYGSEDFDKEYGRYMAALATIASFENSPTENMGGAKK